MNRFFSLRRMTVALAALGLFALAAPRAVAEEVPFHAEGTFTFVLIGGHRADVTGSGHASPGGAFTFEDIARSRVEYGVDVVEVMLTLEFASGSTLTIYYEAPKIDGVVQGTYWVVGGTGLFEGAGGSGTIWYPIGQGEPFTLDGEIDL